MSKDRRLSPAVVDEERQRAFVRVVVLVWAVAFLVLVVRDPLWRLLHEGELVSPPSRDAARWSELDEELIAALRDVEVRDEPGIEELEAALIDAIEVRRGSGGEGQTLEAVVVSDQLRALARTRAAARADRGSEKEDAPELRHPATYFSLTLADRLVRVAEVHQHVPASLRSSSSTFAGEIVDGWMNAFGFGSLVSEAGRLELGVGAVPLGGGGVSIDVVLVETFFELDEPLPAVVTDGRRVELRGRCVDREPLTLYLKSPTEPGFRPEAELDCAGTPSAHGLAWLDGPGSYVLRVGRGERFSDPRPVFVRR